jgi:hypothetical protein
MKGGDAGREGDSGGWQPSGEFALQAFDGESDDVGERAFDPFDDQLAVVLDGIGAGFVEGINSFEILVDLGGIEGPERDVGTFGEEALLVTAKEEYADAGDDLMGAPLERSEHEGGFVEGTGFAEGLAFEADERIGGDGEGVGVLFSDSAGFAVGVELAEFPWGEVIVRDLRDVAGDDLKVEAKLFEEIAATR